MDGINQVGFTGSVGTCNQVQMRGKPDFGSLVISEMSQLKPVDSNLTDLTVNG